MSAELAPSVVVKSREPPRTLAFDVGGSRLAFHEEALLPSIDSRAERGATASATWRRLVLRDGDTAVNRWDLCHALIHEGFGLQDDGVEFAEPDLVQRWVTDQPAPRFALERTCGESRPQDPAFPSIATDDFWFTDGSHGVFQAARGLLDGAGSARVAVLDTGYDRAHAETPARVRRDLERNFVGDASNDASDIVGGHVVQEGHGAAVMSLLAGPTYGAARDRVECVPLRVADRVVLFKNSAIARAFDYVHSLRDRPDARVDVVTMSMGGLASEAWAEAVNALYEAGIFVVTAAGNNFGGLPTRNIVFPARFRRVVAACGVMANGLPYADLGLKRMAGNYGPRSKMDTAMAAYTPNVPWAVLGCGDLYHRTGSGTSSATPQVAAAAALYVARHREVLDTYPEGWMRVEAVRRALFQSARSHGETARLGRGALQADAALRRPPPADPRELKREQRASADFPFLRVLTGLGVTHDAVLTPEQRMVELEALQLSQSSEIEALVADPDMEAANLSDRERRRILQAFADQPTASKALKDAVGAPPHVLVRADEPEGAALQREAFLEHALEPPLRPPSARRLRVYAFDPSLGQNMDTVVVAETTTEVRWEADLQPGPVGEYLEVVDVDPVSGCAYAPVDLNHPHNLGRDGRTPSEADPQFHQQMVYAVAMKTIEHFERALGRTAFWSTRRPKGGEESFVRRLRIHPHAIRGRNAYYSPEQKALLLGYFTTDELVARDLPQDQLVFTCLSYDIVAHETTHALLDGLHPRYRENTNPDVLAFHEAFADLVALFQHFSLPGAVRHQLAATRGELRSGRLLSSVAVQFGRALTGHGSLRSGLDELTGKDVRDELAPAAALPDASHKRGEVLVAAVFDAFISIYEARIGPVLRLATGGSGVLPAGALPDPLVDSLAAEAAKAAGHVLGVCIRALDYCPPVDITFGDYLRAVITADRDLIPDDSRGYRLAFITAFSKRGLYPEGVRSLSASSVAWQPPPSPLPSAREAALVHMKLNWTLRDDRERAWRESRENARLLNAWLSGRNEKGGKITQVELDTLGLLPPGPHAVAGMEGKLGGYEVHSVRPARRVGPDGQLRNDLVVEVTQTWRGDGLKHRGGCTALFDLDSGECRFLVRKRVAHPERVSSLREREDAGLGLHDIYFEGRPQRQPFAALHSPH